MNNTHVYRGAIEKSEQHARGVPLICDCAPTSPPLLRERALPAYIYSAPRAVKNRALFETRLRKCPTEHRLPHFREKWELVIPRFRMALAAPRLLKKNGARFSLIYVVARNTVYTILLRFEKSPSERYPLSIYFAGNWFFWKSVYDNGITHCECALKRPQNKSILAFIKKKYSNNKEFFFFFFSMNVGWNRDFSTDFTVFRRYFL